MSNDGTEPGPTSPAHGGEPLPPQQFTAVNTTNNFARRSSSDGSPTNGTAPAPAPSPLAPIRNPTTIFGGGQPVTVAPSTPVPAARQAPTVAYNGASNGNGVSSSSTPTPVANNNSSSSSSNGNNAPSAPNPNITNHGTPNQSSAPTPSAPNTSSTPNTSAPNASTNPQTPVNGNGNGYAHHDRSRSNSPRMPPPTADDPWQALGSDLAGQKRKRSVSPVTQTQHHHLAAHEAAMGPMPMPEHGLHRMDAMSEDGDRSVRGNTMEETSPHPQSLQMDPITGVRVDPKRRKRVFSNRTKTGCITCRRRKKKCDEGKPECTNCKRGGFVCEGYSGKVSWQKPPGKQIPPSVVTGPPYIQSKEDQPMVDSPIHTHTIPVSTPTSASHRMGMEDRPYHARADELSGGRNATPTQDGMSPRSANHAYLPLRGDNGPTPSASTPQHENGNNNSSSSNNNNSTPNVNPNVAASPTMGGSDRRVSFSSHQALTAASGAMVRPRSEKEKMINSELYHASSPELVAEREACKAACWRYNNIASNPNSQVSEGEKGRMLLDILRPGNKWEVVSTGAAPGTPGAITYVTDNGYQSDIVDVTVDAPFTCSYGYNIRLGKNVYIEFGCTILDSCNVTIKARTILSPGVSIYAATHPIDPRKRNGARGPEMAKPVLIEEDCWLGGNVIVLGGITIGKGSVVGAGSVVTRDVPPFTVVAGNPARVIRGIYHNGVDM